MTIPQCDFFKDCQGCSSFSITHLLTLPQDTDATNARPGLWYWRYSANQSLPCLPLGSLGSHYGESWSHIQLNLHYPVVCSRRLSLWGASECPRETELFSFTSLLLTCFRVEHVALVRKVHPASLSWGRVDLGVFSLKGQLNILILGGAVTRNVSLFDSWVYLLLTVHGIGVSHRQKKVLAKKANQPSLREITFHS